MLQLGPYITERSGSGGGGNQGANAPWGREGIKDSDGEAGRESRIVTVRQGGNQG